MRFVKKYIQKKMNADKKCNILQGEKKQRIDGQNVVANYTMV